MSADNCYEPMNLLQGGEHPAGPRLGAERQGQQDPRLPHGKKKLL